MKASEERRDAGGGVSLFTRRFEPGAGTGPRGTVCLVHGLGEHSGRWTHVAARLTAAGYAVSTFDLRGHGASTGRRGHTPFEGTLADIDALLDDASRRWPGSPRFLYGHSLGGLLVLTYVLRRRPALAGVVSSAAALETSLREQKVKVVLVRLLAPLAPTLTLPSGLDADDLSRDPAVVAAYESDPLVHDRASLAFALDAIRAADAALAGAASFPLPVLLLHGGADRLTDPSGSRAFAAAAPDSTLEVYEGLYHEVHNEPEQARVLDDIVAWLDAHVSR